MGNRREIIEPTLLSYAAHACREYSGIYADGDFIVGLELAEAIIGDILGLGGVGAAGVYTLGDGSIPDVNSISALVSYGGGGATPINNLEYIYPGVKANALRFDIQADSNGVLTVVTIAQPGVKSALGAAVPPSPPDECGVLMPSDIGVVTIGVGEAHETVVCLHSATMEVLIPKTGFDRRCLGGTMQEPITSGRPDVTFNLQLDLDDTTDNNTILLLEAFNAGTPIGEITIGTSFKLTDTIMNGDFPSLDEGTIDFSLNGSASSLEVTTTPAP